MLSLKTEIFHYLSNKILASPSCSDVDFNRIYNFLLLLIVKVVKREWKRNEKILHFYRGRCFHR